jgi:3-oxoacyl-[acyl-carrier-protein] synthase-3
MKSKNFEKESDRLVDLMDEPIIAFEKDFLRWMLSDGAGASLLTNQPNKEGISLKIDWIESASYASELETCMYAGGEKTGNWNFKGWKDFEPEELLARSVFSLRQDVNLLGENIVSFGGRFLKEIVEKRNVDLNKISYFLPHLSSEYFRPKIAEELEKLGLDIPGEKWFTNLTKLGNVGAASIFFMLEELFHSGKLRPGDQILSMVPESARFSYVYALMTVV